MTSNKRPDSGDTGDPTAAEPLHGQTNDLTADEPLQKKRKVEPSNVATPSSLYDYDGKYKFPVPQTYVKEVITSECLCYPNDSRLDYQEKGDWYLDGTHTAHTSKIGAQVSLRFSGTGIEVWVCGNPDRGVAEIFIDDISTGIHQASAEKRWVLLYKSPVLSKKEYTFRLKHHGPGSRAQGQLTAFASIVVIDE